jgi:hypothetical protein
MLSMLVSSGQGYHRFLKRQSSTYLGGSGQVTSSCQDAIVYNLINGQLFANSSGSSTTQFGTSYSAGDEPAYANFTPSANPGNITTAFSVDSQNNLMWTNATFYNNMARFCVLSDNTIVAVFGNPSVDAPDDCLFVSLSMTRVSTCAAAVGNAVQSGPSGESNPFLDHAKVNKDHADKRLLRLLHLSPEMCINVSRPPKNISLESASVTRI